MNRTRCSDPDITFDEDGNLDEQSAEIVLNALEGSDAVKGTSNNFMPTTRFNERTSTLNLLLVTLWTLRPKCMYSNCYSLLNWLVCYLNETCTIDDIE